MGKKKHWFDEPEIVKRREKRLEEREKRAKERKIVRKEHEEEKANLFPYRLKRKFTLDDKAKLMAWLVQHHHKDYTKNGIEGTYYFEKNNKGIRFKDEADLVHCLLIWM